MDERELDVLNLVNAKCESGSPLPPEIVIGCIRTSAPFMETVFLYGSCWRFYLILKSIWPEAEPWCNGDHVLTRIGTAFYDIRGKVKREAGYKKVNPAYVLQHKPHLWICSLERLIHKEKFDYLTDKQFATNMLHHLKTAARL